MAILRLINLATKPMIVTHSPNMEAKIMSMLSMELSTESPLKFIPTNAKTMKDGRMFSTQTKAILRLEKDMGIFLSMKLVVLSCGVMKNKNMEKSGSLMKAKMIIPESNF